MTSAAAVVAIGPIRSWAAEIRRVDKLSDREYEVFVLLGNGDSNRQIAKRLCVTERTVKAHVAKVMAKLEVESRLQAGLVALTSLLLDESSLYGNRRAV